MGYSAQGGQIIVKTQTTPGVLDPGLAASGVGLKVKSGALGTNRELLIPDAEIGSGRDVADAYAGAVSWSGDYEFYCRMDGLATLLKAALGIAAVPATATGVTTHTITPSDAASLPFLSIEEAVGSGFEVFNYYDVVVNTLHVEADANGYFQGTVGLIGARQVAGATRTATPVWDDTPLTVGTNINLTYNGVNLKAKSFSLDINNNFEDDDFRLGSFYLGDLTPKRREITASFGVRHDSSALWRQATYGTSAATAPGGLTTKQALVISTSTYESIPGGTPTTPYGFTMTIPKFALSPFSLEASGDDVLENDIEGQALRPVTSTPICTVVVKTGKATIA